MLYVAFRFVRTVAWRGWVSESGPSGPRMGFDWACPWNRWFWGHARANPTGDPAGPLSGTCALQAAVRTKWKATKSIYDYALFYEKVGTRSRGQYNHDNSWSTPKTPEISNWQLWTLAFFNGWIQLGLKAELLGGSLRLSRVGPVCFWMGDHKNQDSTLTNEF